MKDHRLHILSIQLKPTECTKLSQKLSRERQLKQANMDARLLAAGLVCSVICMENLKREGTGLDHVVEEKTWAMGTLYYSNASSSVNTCPG